MTNPIEVLDPAFGTDAVDPLVVGQPTQADLRNEANVGRIWTTSSPPALLMEDDTIRFNPAAMEIGRPYPAPFENTYLLLLKRSDGSVDVFAIPPEQPATA